MFCQLFQTEPTVAQFEKFCASCDNTQCEHSQAFEFPVCDVPDEYQSSTTIYAVYDGPNEVPF